MRIAFLGSKTLGLRVAEALATQVPDGLAAIVTVDDRTDFRSAFDEFGPLAESKSAELHVAGSRDHADQIIRDIAPDLVVVVGWYWLMRPEILSVATRGFIGMHNSLLPRYRGFSPLVWSLINGEKEIGYSLFTLGEGMDDGPLWLQRRLTVGDQDYVGDLLDKIEAIAPTDIVKVVNGIASGTLEPKPQPTDGASYCARRLPEDGIIDWQMPAEHVRNFIRAQADPYPGAFTFAGDKRITVLRADVLPERYFGHPGQICVMNPDDSITVIAGDNRALRISDARSAEVRGAPAPFIRDAGVRVLTSSG